MARLRDAERAWDRAEARTDPTASAPGRTGTWWSGADENQSNRRTSSTSGRRVCSVAMCRSWRGSKACSSRKRPTACTSLPTAASCDLWCRMTRANSSCAPAVSRSRSRRQRAPTSRRRVGHPRWSLAATGGRGTGCRPGSATPSGQSQTLEPNRDSLAVARALLSVASLIGSWRCRHMPSQHPANSTATGELLRRLAPPV